MNSSAVDARVVIAVEKLLDAGCVLFSEKNGNMFNVLINVPDPVMAIVADVIEPIDGPNVVNVSGESFIGHGATFSEAFNDAYRQLPEREHSAAA